eukprot:PITA_32708
MILGGDLNFSLGFMESWGHMAQINLLSEVFVQMLKDYHWTDFPSAKIQHSWKNNRTGSQRLARKLDRFFIKEAFHARHSRSRQWVGNGEEADPTKGFVSNLKDLKGLSREWVHKKREQEDTNLKQTEKAILDLEEQSEGTFTSPEQKEQCALLIKQRSQILKDREESWRLKSRATWLKEGDENTKFYHRFANGQKSINTIWKLQNDQEQKVNTSKELASLASTHFKSIYSAPGEANILEIMCIAELFPQFVELEEAEELSKEVNLGKLEATIKEFQRDKSPGRDG